MKVSVRYLCAKLAGQLCVDFIYAIIIGIYSDDRRDNNVIFYTIDLLLHGRKPSLTRLEQIWDYVYIDDVVSALMRIGDYGNAKAVYAVGKGDNKHML